MTAAKQREMQEIFESWNYLMFEGVQRLDHIVRRMTSEMSLFGIPADEQVRFLQEQLADMLEQIAEQQSKSA